MLVAFEGIDGTGKSTQIRLLAESLRDMGHTVQLTREPTDGPVGQRIRELYASRDEVSKEEELELFLDDRRQLDVLRQLRVEALWAVKPMTSRV